MKKTLGLISLFCCLTVSAQSYVGNVLVNAGFEDTSATGKANWEVYPSTYASFAYEEEGVTMYGSSRQYPSYWGSWGFKLWGQYNGSENESSVYQTFTDVPAGKLVIVSGLSMTYNEDRIRGENKAFLFIKTFDANWGSYAGSFSDSMDVNSPADIWTPLSVSHTIPAGTKYVQIGIGYYQKSNDDHGGLYFDDLVSYIGDTKVTMNVNTSHIEGLTPRDPGMMVDLRGGSVGDGTGVIANPAWGPGTNLRSSGGDNWTLDIALDNSLVYDFKFGGHIANLDGTVSSYWENDLPGASYSGDNFKMDLSSNTEAATSITHYLGRGPSNDTPPYTATADTVDISFRVNMGLNTDFNPDSDVLSLVGHFPQGGSGDMWSPGTFQLSRVGSSDYWQFHMKLPQTYIDTVDKVNASWATGGLHMYRFAIGTDWNNSENLNGAYHDGNENRILILNTAMKDTTIHWVWWNDKAPTPFTASSKVPSLTFHTNIGKAIANNGWADGDLLLVKWGYGKTSDKVHVDTLVAGVGGDYKITISPTDSVSIDDSLGMYYQYYRVTGGTEYREIFFNFDTTWKDVSLQERRWASLKGKGGTDVSLVDYVDSKTHGRRFPIFRNATKIDANAADSDSLLVTWTTDLRPIYYQLLSYGSDTADSLAGIQGAKTLYYSDRDNIFSWGVWMNGPAIGGWNARGAWGSGLRADSLAKMHDDGTHGDATAGDSVYTVQFNYQKNSTDIGMEFKFGVNAEDNESGFGLNHIENIDVNSPTVVSQFGSINPNRYNAWNFDKGQPGNLAVEELAGIPEVFELSNNYPNPFNPTTSIEFNIPLASEISLTIYNVMGQEVAKVHNGFAQPGAYKAVWNGRDNFGEKAPSGIYFYELKAENHFHKVKKMTLLK